MAYGCGDFSRRRIPDFEGYARGGAAAGILYGHEDHEAQAARQAAEKRMREYQKPTGRGKSRRGCVLQ